MMRFLTLSVLITCLFVRRADALIIWAWSSSTNVTHIQVERRYPTGTGTWSVTSSDWSIPASAGGVKTENYASNTAPADYRVRLVSGGDWREATGCSEKSGVQMVISVSVDASGAVQACGCGQGEPGNPDVYSMTFTVTNPSNLSGAAWRLIRVSNGEVLTSGFLAPGDQETIYRELAPGEQPYACSVEYEVYVDLGELGGQWSWEEALGIGADDWVNHDTTPPSAGTGSSPPPVIPSLDTSTQNLSGQSSTNIGTGGGATEGTLKALGAGLLEQQSENNEQVLRKLESIRTNTLSTALGVSNLTQQTSLDDAGTNAAMAAILAAYGSATSTVWAGTASLRAGLSTGVVVTGTWATNASIWDVPLPGGAGTWHLNPRQWSWFGTMATISRLMVMWLLVVWAMLQCWSSLELGVHTLVSGNVATGGGGIKRVLLGIALAVMTVGMLVGLIGLGVGIISSGFGLGISPWSVIGTPLFSGGAATWWGEALDLADMFVPLGMCVSVPIAAFSTRVIVGSASWAMVAGRIVMAFCACLMFSVSGLASPVEVRVSNGTTNFVAVEDGQSRYLLPSGFAGVVVLDSARTSCVAGVAYPVEQWCSGNCLVSVGALGVSVHDPGDYRESARYAVGGIVGGLGAWACWRVVRRTFREVVEVA